MPFVANNDRGEPVIAGQADADEEYACPECAGTLTIRESHTRGETFVSRHFWHPSGGNGCGGGESDEHKQMKSITISKSRELWADATVTHKTAVGDRVADVLIEFDEPHPSIGNGIAAECQYKHTEKDIDAVTSEFAEEGYSTVWLYPRHFSGKDVDLQAGEWRLWKREQWDKLPTADEWSGTHEYLRRWRRYSSSVCIDVRFPLDEDTALIEELHKIWRQPRWTELPEPHEWSGYHETVYLLQTYQPVPHFVELPLSLLMDEATYRAEIRDAWERGRLTRGRGRLSNRP